MNPSQQKELKEKKMTFEFYNVWKNDTIFNPISFGVWISKCVIIGINYEHEESYPTLYIVLFNFALQINLD